MISTAIIHLREIEVKYKNECFYSFISLRIAYEKRLKISVSKEVEKLDPMYTFGGNVKFSSLYGKSVQGA